MANLDGYLIDEATAGINAPKEGDQLAVVRVDNQQAPDLPNLTYQALADFAAEAALPLANAAGAQAASSPGASSQNSVAHNVDLPLVEGNYFEATFSAVAEDGAGQVAFYSTMHVIGSYPTGGLPVIHDTNVISALTNADWTLAPSISGTNLRAAITNAGASLRYVDVTIGLVRSRAIPAAP